MKNINTLSNIDKVEPNIQYILKDNITAVFKKAIIAIFTFTISILTITYSNGIGKALYNYIIVFTIVIIHCIGSNLLKKDGI